MRKTCLGLAVLLAAGGTTSLLADDFPPYSRPTRFYQFHGGQRIDYVFDALDTLDAAGLEGEAKELRRSFARPKPLLPVRVVPVPAQRVTPNRAAKP